MGRTGSADAGDITLTTSERAAVAAVGADLVGEELPRIDEDAWVARARSSPCACRFGCAKRCATTGTIQASTAC